MSKFMSLVVLGLLLVVVPAARAQTPATLSASGLAEAQVKPENRKSESSIRAAVAAARAQALPKAVTQAKANALELAKAAGVTLGALVSITDAAGQPNYYVPYSYGSFGPNRYCGDVPNYKTVTRDGRKRRVRVKGTHRVCRVPSRVYASATVTFAIS
jgi:uncharacterized protein YggE